jgi:hypothetical protein
MRAPRVALLGRVRCGPGRFSDCLALAALSSLLVGLTACVPSTVAIPGNYTPLTLAPQVVQHTTQLVVPVNQTVKGTVSCGPAEVLLSGGFDTSALEVPSDSYGVLDNYPSDMSGNPPVEQGQIETSWTVTAFGGYANHASPPLSIPITVNCLADTHALSSVWFQGFDLQYNGPVFSASVGCTDPLFATLTGGGFHSANVLMSSYPTAPNGLHHKAWTVEEVHGEATTYQPTDGTAYAVCLSQLVDAPLAEQQVFAPGDPAGWASTPVSVGCPTPGELLVGGGYQDTAELRLATDALVAPQLTAWHVVTWSAGPFPSNVPIPPPQPVAVWGICVTTA